ncbi:hypothetical protein [Rhizobium leguminosarum]|uniref:hypothetical protein n=1 Tax=Rhizobium leguminosarum TaxID=384 RepID=UPI00143F46EB|nr:hypothetical protein [Rhizobium leguminosarum]NKL18050.1 hypothetical protein [Rhizobium leguminosarum bv. viciae]
MVRPVAGGLEVVTIGDCANEGTCAVINACSPRVVLDEIMNLNVNRLLFFRVFPLVVLCLIIGWIYSGAPGFPAPSLKLIAVAGWQPRDSAGEFVYHDKLWLLGGWKCLELDGWHQVGSRGC